VTWLRIVLCWLCVAGVAAGMSAEEKKPAAPAKAPAAESAPESAPARGAEALHPVAGTGVSIAVPPCFNASTDFPGIGRAADLSSVMVTELDVPLAIATDAFSPDAMARRDIVVDSTTPLVVDGRQTTLITTTQKIGSMSFRKWFVLLGNDTRSVLLTATTPARLEAQHRDALLHALESARWDEAGKAAAPPTLSFQVKEAAPLRIVRSGADSIVLSDPQAVKGHVTPLVAVGASQAHVDVGDLATFAKTRLDETVSIHDISVETQGPRTLGSLEGYQIAATAVDAESQRPVQVQQILASDGARYYLVQGIFDAEDAKQLAPAFEAVASSFALRNSRANPPPR
jgi:hypothetical protein